MSGHRPKEFGNPWDVLCKTKCLGSEHLTKHFSATLFKRVKALRRINENASQCLDCKHQKIFIYCNTF